MKKIIIVLLTTALISPLVMANTDKNKSDNMTFEERKAKVSAKIERRANALEAARQCVNKATTKEQLQACKPKKKLEQN